MPLLVDRKRRLGLHLPLDVSGRDLGGAPFAERTRSLNVSGGGLCFETHHNLLFGSQISVHIQLPAPLRRHFGGRSVYRARAVICRVERKEPEAMARIGARFLGELEA